MQDTEGSTRPMKRQKSSSQATAFNATSDVIDLSNDDDINTDCDHDLSTPICIKLHGSTSGGGAFRRQTHQACPAGIALLNRLVCRIWQFHLGTQHCCMSVNGLNNHQIKPLSILSKPVSFCRSAMAGFKMCAQAAQRSAASGRSKTGRLTCNLYKQPSFAACF